MAADPHGETPGTEGLPQESLRQTDVAEGRRSATGEDEPGGMSEGGVGVDKVDADRLRALVGARLFGGAADPVKIGRFTVLKRLGAGGMGVVYAAYDDQLDRKVAIKLLRRMGPGDAHAQRLMREAQALARLSHPNVIQVYEVGTHEGQVFVAMEFVKGHTLGDWKPDASFAEVLEVYGQAGRGLAAAHAAGLVHRDFKPDNVLVGEDGRARVLDFGLARSAGETEPDLTDEELSNAGIDTSGDSFDSPLTQTGAIMGTPAYMAPEQHLGRATDHRTDQFAFCIALWERLYGERPYSGKSLGELALNVTTGKVVDPPSSRRVPAWVRRALHRGLATHPSDRYASMDELLAVLDRDPRRLRRVAIGVAAAVGLALGAFVAFGGGDQVACDNSAQQLHGVWDDGVRDKVHAAFESTGVPYADDAWLRTRRLLDEYTTRWVEMHQSACESAVVRSETSEELYGQQLVCLSQRLQEVKQLGRVLADADAAMVRKSVQAVEQLPSLDDCTDQAMLELLEVPVDEETRRKREAIDAKIARAGSESALGRYEAALELAQEAVEEARAAGHDKSIARALLIRGRIEAKLSEWASARESLREAQRVADRSGADRARAEAAIQLVWVVGTLEPDYEESLSMAEDASAALDRLGEAPLMRAELANYLGSLATNQGRYEDGIRHHAEALEIRERELGDSHTTVGISLNNLGNAYDRAGKLDEAEDYLQRALGIFEDTLGSEHTYVAYTVNNLGNIALQKGGPPGTPEARVAAERAEPYYRRSIQIRERNFGRNHPSMATTVHNLALCLLGQGKYIDALETFRRAIRIKEVAFGPDHVRVAMSLTGEGKALLGLGRAKDAVEPLERSLELMLAADGTDPMELGETAFALAQALEEIDPEGARKAAKRAADAYRAAGELARPPLEQVEAWLEAHPA